MYWRNKKWSPSHIYLRRDAFASTVPPAVDCHGMTHGNKKQKSRQQIIRYKARDRHVDKTGTPLHPRAHNHTVNATTVERRKKRAAATAVLKQNKKMQKQAGDSASAKAPRREETSSSHPRSPHPPPSNNWKRKGVRRRVFNENGVAVGHTATPPKTRPGVRRRPASSGGNDSPDSRSSSSSNSGNSGSSGGSSGSCKHRGSGRTPTPTPTTTKTTTMTMTTIYSKRRTPPADDAGNAQQDPALSSPGRRTEAPAASFIAHEGDGIESGYGNSAAAGAAEPATAISKEEAFLRVAEDVDGGKAGAIMFPEFVEALTRLCLARYAPLAPARSAARSNGPDVSVGGLVLAHHRLRFAFERHLLPEVNTLLFDVG